MPCRAVDRGIAVDCYCVETRWNMGTYSFGQDKRIMIYDFQRGLYMRRWSGQSVMRPQLLSNDYRGDLSDIYWRGTIYYGYQNQVGEYLVNNLSEPGKKFVLRPAENRRLCFPRLILFREKLMILYIEEKEWEGDCRIKGAYLGEREEVVLPEKYSSRPDYRVIQCGDELLIGVNYEREWRYYGWRPGNHWEELASWQSWLEAKRDEWEEKQYKSREETEHLRQDLQYSKQLIESIKSQYEELMDTATKYREEAKKWRDQYIASCSGKISV